MSKLYLRTTQDELELPIAVADSPTELARMLGTTANNVSSSIAHGRKGWYAVLDEPEKFCDNDGRLWYWNEKGETVYVE